MGSISTEQPHRFGQSLGGIFQREEYIGETSVPWSSQEPCQGMLLHPGSLLSMGAMGEQQGMGDPLSPSETIPLCTGTHRLSIKWDALSRADAACVPDFLAKWVGTANAEHEPFQHRSTLPREAHVCQAQSGHVKWVCTWISL